MCFTKHADHPDAKIAARNIKCWKEFRYLTGLTGFESKHKCFNYKFDKLYCGQLIDSFDDIHVGFHSYSKKPNIFDHIHVIECYIPKGSKYYYNPKHGEYVSNSIYIRNRKYMDRKPCMVRIVHFVRNFFS